ncbi:MAG: hypothetical protein H0U52_15130 [Chloroflexi bacterium]|nr:hypothetical protein [Chloroflexota bacterium]
MTASATDAGARSVHADRAAAPTAIERPGRWIGGLLGAIASLALVPISLIIEPAQADGDLGVLASLGLLGSPVGFVLGREAFPEARSGGWRHALGIGLLVGLAAPPLGLIVIALLSLLLPGTGIAPDPLSTSGLLILTLGIPYSFLALPVTLPVGLLWAVLVRLVAVGLPARLRVPPPLDRVGVRHAVLIVVVVGCAQVARHAGAL